MKMADSWIPRPGNSYFLFRGLPGVCVFRPRLSVYNTLGAFFCNSVTPKGASVQSARPQPAAACLSPFPASQLRDSHIRWSVKGARTAVARVPSPAIGGPDGRPSLDGLCGEGTQVPSVRGETARHISLFDPLRENRRSSEMYEYDRLRKGGFFPVSVFLLIQIKRRAGAVCRAGRERFARPFQPTSFGRRLRNGRIRRSIIPPRLMMAHEPRVGARHKARRLQENNVRSSARTRFEPILNGRAPALRSCGVCNASLFRAYPSVPLFERERPFVGAHRRAAIQRW